MQPGLCGSSASMLIRSQPMNQDRTHIRHRRRHGHVHRQHCLQQPVGVSDSESSQWLPCVETVGGVAYGDM